MYVRLGPVTIEAVSDVNTSTAVVIPRKTIQTDTTQKQLDKKIYHGCMLEYFLSQPHSERRAQELPWHVAACKQYRTLQQVLAEPK